MTITDSPFTLRPDGVIVLPDDDGDPAYYLQPDQAYELQRFIDQNHDAIDTAASQTRTARAYADLAAGIAAGMPAPHTVRVRWDGRLELDIKTAEEFDAWAAFVGPGTADVDSHPTLGERKMVTAERLHVEGPWDHVVPEPEQVSA